MPEVGLELYSRPRKRWESAETCGNRSSSADLLPGTKREALTLSTPPISQIFEPARARTDLMASDDVDTSGTPRYESVGSCPGAKRLRDPRDVTVALSESNCRSRPLSYLFGGC